MSDRGLVVFSPATASQHGLTVASSDLDPQELRFALLFWDKIDFPQSNIMRISGGRDAEFLESAGVLQRTTVRVGGNTISSGEIGQLVHEAFIRAFYELDAASPGTWSVSSGINSLQTSFPLSDLIVDRGTIVTLHRAIPIPNQDVPLQEILDFRKRRRDTLLGLRHHLERIYQTIAESPDRPLAENTEVEALGAAINDYIKSAGIAKFLFRNMTLSANLNWLKVIGTAAASYNLGLSLPVSALATAAAGLSVSSGVSLKRGSKTSTPFRYISQFHQEVFGLSA